MNLNTEYNNWMKSNDCYNYFYNNIQTSQLKLCHFNPTSSDGNIEQVYGKLHPRAVRHNSVMAPAFGVRLRGESFTVQFHRKYSLLSTLLFEWAQCHRLQAGPELLWSMILPYLMLSPVRLGHCFSGMLQYWLNLTFQVCACVYVRDIANKGCWLFMTAWDDFTVNLHTCTNILIADGNMI